jgi:hypothetical protein
MPTSFAKAEEAGSSGGSCGKTALNFCKNGARGSNLHLLQPNLST